jgi:hypothetical protein
MLVGGKFDEKMQAAIEAVLGNGAAFDTLPWVPDEIWLNTIYRQRSFNACEVDGDQWKVTFGSNTWSESTPLGATAAVVIRLVGAVLGRCEQQDKPFTVEDELRSVGALALAWQVMENIVYDFKRVPDDITTTKYINALQEKVGEEQQRRKVLAESLKSKHAGAAYNNCDVLDRYLTTVDERSATLTQFVARIEALAEHQELLQTPVQLARRIYDGDTLKKFQALFPQMQVSAGANANRKLEPQ